MDTWIVTGGAGFIGCNFVRLALEQTEARIVVFDSLTYAGNLQSLADVSDHERFQFVRADIADRSAVERAAIACIPPERGGELRRRDPRRPLDRGPRGLRPHTNLVGTFEVLDACPPPPGRAHAPRTRDRLPAASTSRPTRSTARSARSGAFTETTPYAPELALLRLEGRRRPPGARLPRHLRAAGAAHDQLLEQLRALPVSRRS